jgi:hypothetical protein
MDAESRSDPLRVLMGDDGAGSAPLRPGEPRLRAADLLGEGMLGESCEEPLKPKGDELFIHARYTILGTETDLAEMRGF